MKNPILEFEKECKDRDYPLINQLLVCISELSPLENHEEYGSQYNLLYRNQIMEFYG